MKLQLFSYGIDFIFDLLYGTITRMNENSSFHMLT